MVRISHYFSRFASEVYSGRVESWSKSIGIDSAIRGGYQSLIDTVSYAEYKLAGQRQTVSIGDLTAEFSIDNRRIFQRCSSLANETEVLQLLSREVQPDDVFWDVGANIGIYTCLLGNRISEGKIVSFEPFPNNVECLRRNIDINGLDNVDVITSALGEKNGKITLSIQDDEAGAGLSSTASGSERPSKMSVDVLKGDDLIADGTPVPNALKIDVEGAELSVLRGIETTLTEKECRLVLCEVHNTFGVNPADVAEILTRCGFSTDDVYERGRETFLIGRK